MIRGLLYCRPCFKIKAFYINKKAPVYNTNSLKNAFIMYCGLIQIQSVVMKKTILNLLVLFLAFSQNASSQDIHFSQIFETPLLRNPALAGLFTGDVRIQSVYRNQWNSVTVPYQTTSLSGEFKRNIGKA